MSKLPIIYNCLQSIYTDQSKFYKTILTIHIGNQQYFYY
jgi:hypothetical protein